MYEFLSGKIVSITPGYIVIDVNGVGFKVFCPTPYYYELNQVATVYVEQIIRENDHSLFGFKNLDDKLLFEKLLSVSGIGPKSALAIMAAENSVGLATAIENGEVNYLTRFPGIGKKTAQQIVLDLKGKLGDYQNGEIATPSQKISLTPALSDALLALTALGYSEKEVDKISAKLAENDFDKAEDYIRVGLNLLLKKGK